jgi:hypothetical protein
MSKHVTAAIGYNIWVTVQNLLEGDFMGKWYPLRNKWRHYLEPHYAHNGLMLSIPITDPVLCATRLLVI